ncbi:MULTISPECIES: SRPBCC family protein [unclassified Streptomyces]|uniref:SRPBCC family protein n=1 Tax=unclassified Streptomyces TaxID=2593676 RepID=UPI001925AA89|nr:MULTISPECIES: SRPBCC family protein [unclassified Streptomyces]
MSTTQRRRPPQPGQGQARGEIRIDGVRGVRHGETRSTLAGVSSLAVTASSHSSASAAIVYAALLDAESWPLWSAYADVEWDVPAGIDRPARVNDLRTIRSPTGRVCCRERIVEMVPDQRFSYEQAAGLFTSHRGSVDLARALHGGTDVTWSATYRRTLPLLDMLRRRRLQVWVHDLASYANSIVSRNS